MRYHRQLMNAILRDKVQIAKAVNATSISLDEAPQGYAQFDSGSPRSSSSTPTASLPREGPGEQPAGDLAACS